MSRAIATRRSCRTIPFEAIIDEAFIRDGMLDMIAMRPIARCGDKDYLVADKVFQMERPPKRER